uniref:Uncharacterized protein LOC113798225 n=1 Tax=Dermatophagoides pteronyssinus TaxID=6956 RepID=A0A6P6YIE7_DERPT
AKDAICRAVFPFLVAVLTFAPRRINSVTTGTCPSFDAKCNAFKPFALQVLISKLPFKYSRTFSKFPARAARKKLATPSVCCCQGFFSVWLNGL